MALTHSSNTTQHANGKVRAAVGCYRPSNLKSRLPFAVRASKRGDAERQARLGLLTGPKHPHTTLILVTFTSISAEMCESTAQFDFRDSLEPNWRYSADEIARSPSVQSGMSADEELYLQWSCCKYIEDVASRLVGEKYPFTYC